jgi:hypothetical protein
MTRVFNKDIKWISVSHENFENSSEIYIKDSQLLDQRTESKQRFFTYIGPLDSQHKMIKTHGGNMSLFFLLFFYFYLFYLIFKIYFKSNNIGIILLVLTSLVIATSTGFPVFFW